ncbi:MAG: MarC family protein [Myxococcaceae bacterium]|nr:MarC family protein [Myxococcaceae bacterium]MBH2006373.1 MarC family protein [Myxococcaceae bacterium]
MELISDIFMYALPLFILLDPFGTVGILSSFLKNYQHRTQLRIIFFESIIALIIMLGALLCGEYILRILHISHAALQLSGGVVFSLFALQLLFPHFKLITLNPTERPFISPIAVPLIASPSLLATITIFSQKEISFGILVGAIVLAWGAGTLILLQAPLLVRLLKNSGLRFLEEMSGILCLLVAVQMFIDGILSFLGHSH